MPDEASLAESRQTGRDPPPDPCQVFLKAMNKFIEGLRLNHVQLTIPEGSLATIRNDLLSFYCYALGFGLTSIDQFGPNHLFLTLDSEGSQFIYVSEHAKPMSVGGDDHVGLHLQDRAAVDWFLGTCKTVQSTDSRMEIRELEDLELEQTITHAFYFRYLLPLWFDIQVIEYRRGHEPRRRWTFR